MFVFFTKLKTSIFISILKRIYSFLTFFALDFSILFKLWNMRAVKILSNNCRTLCILYIIIEQSRSNKVRKTWSQHAINFQVLFLGCSRLSSRQILAKRIILQIHIDLLLLCMLQHSKRCTLIRTRSTNVIAKLFVKRRDVLYCDIC